MSHAATQLELDPATDDPVGPTACALPDIPPQFFIPRLDDKPQNPIMDTLRLTRGHRRAHTTGRSLSELAIPPELQLISEDLVRFEQAKRERLELIWGLSVSRKHGYMNQALSWDALRTSFSSRAAPSPFLSEQPTDIFASARYHVRPPLSNPEVQVIYVQVPDLLDSLLLNVSGTSSHLHIWNHEFQRFLLRNTQDKQSGQIVIVGKDEVVSASMLDRFLTIGNLMRRLELITDDRNTGRVHPHPTPISHAFTHALSSILGYLRQAAEIIPPDLQSVQAPDARFLALWTRHEDMEHILRALATLCGREESSDPSDYADIPATPTILLSLIYRHLADHIDRSSPRIVTAMLAYLLTTTSRGYIQTLCASVGYNTPSSKSNTAALTNGRTRQEDPDRLYAGGVELEDNGLANGNGDDDGREFEPNEYPEFVVAEVAEVLSRARKSLILLRAADPSHPLLISKRLHPEIEWLWTEEQLENMESILTFGRTASLQTEFAHDLSASAPPSTPSDVMDAFKVFDLLPGELGSTRSSAHGAANLLTSSNSTSTLRAFLISFPPTLPSFTPTLTHLTTRVLAPLIAHAQALSGALVARFLTPSTHLYLHAHLVLLRGYLLITNHAFKSRLQDALFLDAEDISPPVVGSRTYAASEARARQRSRTKSGTSRSRSRTASGVVPQEKDDERLKLKPRRAVGLSPSLTIGDKWPPLGSDLNFLLRTVIVDALDEGRLIRAEREDVEGEDETTMAQRRIVTEAEWRLGFAIRDLPVGTGREKWLNPLSIEALDFLYMHYQPPHPLDILITPAILSKYHRMFSFNLRLMRVENVVRTLFRLTRSAKAPLFPTFTPCNKLLLHCRFVAHSFVMSLSSYVYDIAIGSNIDAFLARLVAASPSSDLGASTSTSAGQDRDRDPTQEPRTFSDVFSLAEHHSKVLDDVLSSCLLRSGQKAVGDILRSCLELVLELGVLAGEIRDGNLEEYEAAPMLEDLWAKFRAKMTTFVKVLQALVEKEVDASGLVLSDIPLHMMQGHQRVSGTTANLHQLLLRLNMADWWTKDGSRPEY